MVCAAHSLVQCVCVVRLVIGWAFLGGRVRYPFAVGGVGYGLGGCVGVPPLSVWGSGLVFGFWWVGIAGPLCVSPIGNGHGR